MQYLIGLLYFKKINGNYFYEADRFWFVFFGSRLCQVTEQLRTKTGNPLNFFVSLCFYYYYILLVFLKNLIITQDDINCLHNTKKGWRLLLGIILYQLMEQIRPKIGISLVIVWFSLSIFLILCLHNVSNKYYRGTGSYQLSSQHKG